MHMVLLSAVHTKPCNPGATKETVKTASRWIALVIGATEGYPTSTHTKLAHFTASKSPSFQEPSKAGASGP
jgi:hypothetical protein